MAGVDSEQAGALDGGNGGGDRTGGFWGLTGYSGRAGDSNGGFPVFNEYFRAGVDTIFAMHINEDDLLRLRGAADQGDTLVVTGHMTTDSIGINAVISGME